MKWLSIDVECAIAQEKGRKSWATNVLPTGGTIVISLSERAIKYLLWQLNNQGLDSEFPLKRR